jgi:hypothetical protein
MMDRIWQDMQDPAWWVSVVVAGLVMNVLAAYVKEWLDGFIAQFSRSYRQEMERMSRERRERIATMATNREHLDIARHLELRHKLVGIYMIVLGTPFTGYGLYSYSLSVLTNSSTTSDLIALAIGLLLISNAQSKLLISRKIALEVNAAHQLFMNTSRLGPGATT